MHDVAAVDGRVTVEISALYALHFADALNLSMVLLLRDHNDSLEIAGAGMERLQTVAWEYGVTLATVLPVEQNTGREDQCGW